MAHTDACKIQVCQLLEQKLQRGLTIQKAAREIQVESDGIPAETIRRWWREIRKEVEDESPQVPENTVVKNDHSGNADSYTNKTVDETVPEVHVKEHKQATEPVSPTSIPERPPAIHVPVFNETNENIDWARFTWNPVTGCLHGCKYCYARDIANRFFKQKFKPTFHPGRLAAPKSTLLPESKNGSDRNVFVCSMADLFGEWVKQEWIDRTLEAVRNAPEWNFIFLTKNPERMIGIDWPLNTKVGATVDVQERVERTEKAFQSITAPVKFLSCEPLLEELQFSDLSVFDCIIVGAQSRSTQCQEMQPDRAWVTELLIQAEESGVKRVFLKPNLTVYKEAP